MTADPIRLAVVGLGAMGTRMLTAARAHPDYTVVAGVDVAPRTLDVPVVTSLDDVLSDVDAVYVSTPPASHAELVLKAFQAGKAVFCEKPLAVDLDEARTMAEAAANRPNAVNFALSDMVATIEIERRLAELGALRGVEIRLQFPRWPRAFQAEAAWLARSEQGGFVREVLSHFVYLTDRLLGPLTVEWVSSDFPEPGAAEVAARGGLRGSGVPVHVSAFSGLAGPEIYEWTVWGTERSLRLDQWALLSTSDGGGWEPVPLEQTGSDYSRLTLFAQAVRGEHPRDLADFASGLRVAEVIEAFLR
ncbi:Gfo/Idh/MocA family oxidoreductase [Lentzea sp. BCCO 10_0856]|uniref:Gfo/Idh/MocA family oxidoreductase n=1 Tax=Lentzea miocenica TaxID=3095431 RepID=A0ABU4SSX5_9PSEU|nr:Gfo/Idh/MocA family oxidoreductase [Lentzea sp. BCCO 10_0856]MDX8028986.1 Gfo/Idh/MocA family oxidoreductase [Lentzea sp. BCCO 10_0856]